jgi:hypothetical protein
MVKEYNKHLSGHDIINYNMEFGPFKVPKRKDLVLLDSHPELERLKWLPDGHDISFTVSVAFKLQKRT